MLTRLLGRMADRLILWPTKHPIEVTDKRCLRLNVGGDRVEVWEHDVGPVDRELDVLVLKFAGTGGRAEYSTDQPACFWPELRVRLWTVNPPGYGGSTGRAGVAKLAPTARAVYEHGKQAAAGRPLVLFANSLGGTCALHLAARFHADGLILRNPPPLRQIILARFGWRTGLLGAWLIARQVPEELDSLANARRAMAPAVFLMSERDTIVPPKHQRLIHQAYRGPKNVVVLKDAGHATSLTPDDVSAYQESLAWLWSSILARRQTR